MKKRFSGHFPPSKSDIKHLWESCLFTVDANILLNLYRYSDSTRKEVLQVFKAIKDRLWLPHHAAQEYFNNRLAVISQQEKAYEEAIKTIQTLQSDLSNVKQHPFISDKLMKKLSAVIEEVVGELGANKSVHTKRTQADEIQEAIGNLFNGRVGVPYSEEDLEKICKKGEDRYTRKVPPGYKDDGKDDTSSILSKYRKYGDLIIWRQIIDKANEAKKGIIFVNDDKKDDWYLIFRGKSLGPRPELIIEFLNKCSQSFYMYQADRFLEFTADYLKQEITPASVDEIRDLRRQDLARREHLMKFRQEEAMLRARARHTEVRISKFQKRIAYLQEKLEFLQQKQAVIKERLSTSKDNDSGKLEQIPVYMRELEQAQMEYHQVRLEYEDIQKDYAMHQNMLSELEFRLDEHGWGRENQ
ncbi:MAG: PIN domain-containing protein [Deltaproteobacteria bacterium]|nr:PIN domain-containing protein [Deltaproteobacteria bacterium]